jgi:hypothetical protein
MKFLIMQFFALRSLHPSSINILSSAPRSQTRPSILSIKNFRHQSASKLCSV